MVRRDDRRLWDWKKRDMLDSINFNLLNFRLELSSCCGSFPFNRKSSRKFSEN